LPSPKRCATADRSRSVHRRADPVRLIRGTH
jgi:hypothetical protein